MKGFLAVSFLCVIGIIFLLLTGWGATYLAPLISLLFVSLAIGVRGTDTIFKSFSFSLWVIASVALAMFYPEYFLEIGTFELSILIVPLIQVIMFGMMISILNMIILPIVLGLLFNRYLGGRIKWLNDVMPVISMIGIIFIISIITALAEILCLLWVCF